MLPDSTAAEAIRSLLKYKISGAPVVEKDGQLVGIISEYQLLAVVYDDTMKARRVRELMSSNIVSVEEQTPVRELADLFVVHRIRRVPVVRDGRLVGLVSRRDLLSHAVTHHPETFGELFHELALTSRTA